MHNHRVMHAAEPVSRQEYGDIRTEKGDKTRGILKRGLKTGVRHFAVGRKETEVTR